MAYQSNTLASAGLRLCSSVFWSADKLISLVTLTVREADFARSMTSCLLVVASWEMAARTYRVGAILSETIKHLRKLSLLVPFPPSKSMMSDSFFTWIIPNYVHLATSLPILLYHCCALLNACYQTYSHVLVVFNTKALAVFIHQIRFFLPSWSR